MIGPNGEQVGVVPIAVANAQAEAAELDLVEIAPTAVPPVCRVMDFGKFKYRESKRRHEAKLKQKQIIVKEVKFRPSTDEGDYKIKLRNLTRFLDEGDKCKVTLRFRGREMAHRNLGREMIDRLIKDVAEKAIVEFSPRMEGNTMHAILAPRKVEPAKAPKQQAPPQQQQGA